MQQTTDQMLAERGSRYGEFDEHARITQSIKHALTTGQSWTRCTASHREALEMIVHKVGRIVNGDPNYVDSWADIIGYAQLAINDIQREQNGKCHDVKSTR